MQKDLEVMIIDDHKLFSAGLKSILDVLNRPCHIAQFYCGATALTELEKNSTYDLILIDLEMPSLTGIDLLRAIRARNYQTKPVMVSATNDLPTIQNAIDNGARGFIPKTLAPEMMIDGIEKVLRGESFIPSHLEGLIFFDSARNTNQTNKGLSQSGDQKQPATETLELNDRQREVLELLMQGKSNKQIADILQLSTSTIKFHLTFLFRKFNAKSRTECVFLAKQSMTTNH